MYHLCKPVDDGEDQILTGAFPISKYRQSRPSSFSDWQVSEATASLVFFLGNKFLSCLNAKVASQLNSDNFKEHRTGFGDV